MSKELIQSILEDSKRLTAEKSTWNPQWQMIHEYFLQRKADFTSQRADGAFINSDIWTAIPGKAAETASSAVLGLVWPDSYSFALEPFGDLHEDEDAKKWFSEVVTPAMQADLDDPEAGLSLALEEFMLDFFVSGTPAIHSEEGENSTYMFDAWNVQEFSIDEGPNGFVDTFHRDKEYTIRQAVRKFGLDNLSKKTQQAHKNKQLGDKIKIKHVIQPREVLPGKGSGAQNMPFMSIYIETDAEHIVRESGYRELPTFAVRYSKRIGEKYGRSPSFRALPDAMELNALWEIVTLGLEKNFDPPLAVYDDGFFGGGTIDTSAGAINVMNVSGKIAVGGGPPIQPLFTVGQFGDVAVLIERLEDTISDHFMIDILLDLNNEKDMTAREYIGRQAVRQKAMRSVITRLLTELFNRLLERCFNIGLRKGRFGYVEGSPEAAAWQAMNPGRDIKHIPDRITQMQGTGERVYRIKYKTPAAREAEAEQAQGILNLLEVLPLAAEVDPTVRDEINISRTFRKLGELFGAPNEIWSTEAEKKVLAEGRAQQNQKSSQIAEAQAVAGIAKDASMAQSKQQSATPMV